MSKKFIQSSAVIKEILEEISKNLLETPGTVVLAIPHVNLKQIFENVLLKIGCTIEINS